MKMVRHSKVECLQAIVKHLTPEADAPDADEKKKSLTTLLNTPNISGMTPLMIAAQLGADEIIKVLVEAGADVNASDNDKLTALHHAAEAGLPKTVELLLSHGATVDAKDVGGNMATHKAALKGHHTVLAGLARGGADLAAVNGSGVTPLMSACVGGFIESVRVLLLFTPPDAILRPDADGNTSLHVSAQHGRDEIIRVLLQNPAAPLDIDQANKEGNTPVVLALIEKHVDTARVLIAFGAAFALDSILKHKLRHIPEATLAALNAEALMVSKDERPLTANIRSTFGAGNSRRSSSITSAPSSGPSGRRRHAERTNSEATSMDAPRESLSALSLSPSDVKKMYRASEAPNRRGSSKRSKSPSTLDDFHGVPDLDPTKETKPNSAVITRDAIALFATKPEKALNMLIENNLLKDNCSDVATFLYKSSELDSTSMGNFLSEPKEFNKAVLESFMTLFDFRELDFDVALRRFLAKFRLPGEAQKIDRLMESFARRYYAQNPKSGPFADQDAVYVLAFSTIMLNTDAHNPSIKPQNKMTKPQFLRNNAGLNGGKNYPDEFLGDLYDRITKNEIKMERQEEIFVNAEKKGWLLKQGGRVKTFSRRWFLLSESVLFSFDKQSDKEPSGIIPLENLVVQPSTMKKAKHAFELKSAEGGLIKATMRKGEGGLVVANTDCFTFQASSDEEMNEWIDAIRRNVYRNPFHQLMAAKRQQATTTNKEVVVKS
jgi:ankyrin repeat protein